MSSIANPVFAATIAGLARRPDLRALNLATLHGVMAVRLCALFDHAQREPLAELAQRFRSFEAAEAVLDLVRAVTRAWPEPFVTGRPCCLALSPDEATLAAMLRTAGRGDRDGFGSALVGFVRAERHEGLYDASVRAVALLEAANA